MATIGEFFQRFINRPGFSISCSFAAVILIGSALLSLPQATVDHKRLPFVDTLFIATSATCVTGLTVVKAESLSKYGQTIIILLVQAGGLGIMTWAIFFRVALGRRLSMLQQSAVLEFFGVEHRGFLKRLLLFMIIFTFTIEAIGFLIMLPFFMELQTPGEALFTAAFHAVSAFCNAGFSTFNNNLQSFRGSILITMTISSLIILGGLGMPIIYNLWYIFLCFFTEKWAPKRLSLHTKLGLITDAVLIGLGFGLFYLFERGHSLEGLPWQEQVLASYFHSVTPRTAGFSTISIGKVSEEGLALIMFLMFVGGSPGSTAGGIKNTTLAVLMVALASFCRGKEEVECFGRTLARDVVSRALTVATWGVLIVVVACVILFNTEPFPFEAIMFEVLSAFDTVGLSTGITSQLSLTGKLVIIVTMFIGRIGPLTLALMVGRRVVTPGIRYPEEHVSVG